MTRAAQPEPAAASADDGELTCDYCARILQPGDGYQRASIVVDEGTNVVGQPETLVESESPLVIGDCCRHQFDLWLAAGPGAGDEPERAAEGPA